MMETEMQCKRQRIAADGLSAAGAAFSGADAVATKIPPTTVVMSPSHAVDSSCSASSSSASASSRKGRIDHFPLLSLPDLVLHEVVSFFPAVELARTSATSKYMHEFAHEFAERTFRPYIESRPHAPKQCPRTWPACCSYSIPLEASSYIERLGSVYDYSAAVLKPGNEVWLYGHASERDDPYDEDTPSDVDNIRDAVLRTMKSCREGGGKDASSLLTEHLPAGSRFARVGGYSGGASAWILGRDAPALARRRMCDGFYSLDDAEDGRAHPAGADGHFRGATKGFLAAARPMVMNRLEVLLIEGSCLPGRDGSPPSAKFKAPDLHCRDDTSKPTIAFRTYISRECESCYAEVLPGEFCDECRFYDTNEPFSSDPAKARRHQERGIIRPDERSPATEFLLLSAPREDAAVLGRAKLGWENFDAGIDGGGEVAGPTFESVEGTPRKYGSPMQEKHYITLVEYVMEWVALMFPHRVELQSHHRVWRVPLVGGGDCMDLLEERGWDTMKSSIMLGKDRVRNRDFTDVEPVDSYDESDFDFDSSIDNFSPEQA